MADQNSKNDRVITKRRIGAAAMLTGIVAGIAMAWPVAGPSLDSHVPTTASSWSWR